MWRGQNRVLYERLVVFLVYIYIYIFGILEELYGDLLAVICVCNFMLLRLIMLFV
jgi:hypothetical protein